MPLILELYKKYQGIGRPTFLQETCRFLQLFPATLHLWVINESGHKISILVCMIYHLYSGNNGRLIISDDRARWVSISLRAEENIGNLVAIWQFQLLSRFK